MVRLMAIVGVLLLGGGAFFWTGGLCAALETQVFEVRLTRADFDASDSTDVIQKAFDSGAKRVCLENVGTSWNVSRTLMLRSDQHVVFAPGVVLAAKRGCFKGKGDCLLQARGVENLVLEGPGATLFMRKAEYHTADYIQAEWRHALSILSCRNVRVLGLTLKDSGGDGIYLGSGTRGVTNSDIVIKDCVCDGNNRQGISVITARNLLIENCRLINTSGTAPEAGIDFEPNRPDEMLVNCVMRDCLVENNQGHGMHFYLKHLDQTSLPVSVRLENCRTKGNGRAGLSIVTASGHAQGVLKGEIEAVESVFEQDGVTGVLIRDNDTRGCRVTLRECTIRDPKMTAPEVFNAPIVFSISPTAATGAAWGNVHLRQLLIEQSSPSERLIGHVGPSAVLEGIVGEITWMRNGESTTWGIKDTFLAELFPVCAVMKRFEKKTFEGLPPAAMPSLSSDEQAEPIQGPWLREHASLLALADEGQSVSVAYRMRPVGRQPQPPLKTPSVTVLGPGGEAIASRVLREKGEDSFTVEFTAPRRGRYRISADMESNAMVVSPREANVPLGLDLTRPAHLFHFKGMLHFILPKTESGFAVLVTGMGMERVKATLRNENGVVVAEKDNIERTEPLIVDQPAARASRWSLELAAPSEGVLEDVLLDLRGVPPYMTWNRTTLGE